LLHEVLRVTGDHPQEARQLLRPDLFREKDLLDAPHEQLGRHGGELSVLLPHGLSLEAEAKPAHDEGQRGAGGHRGLQLLGCPLQRSVEHGMSRGIEGQILGGFPEGDQEFLQGLEDGRPGSPRGRCRCLPLPIHDNAF
jgi:hypothetical protein